MRTVWGLVGALGLGGLVAELRPPQMFFRFSGRLGLGFRVSGFGFRVWILSPKLT